MKILLIVFSFLLFIKSQAQISTGTWRFHSATSKAIAIAASESTVFTAFENGLFEYDIASKEKKLWTAINGLSDIEISTLYFYAETNQLYIGYKNGNIDVLKEGEIYNIPALKLASIPYSKKINSSLKFIFSLFLIENGNNNSK